MMPVAPSQFPHAIKNAETTKPVGQLVYTIIPSSQPSALSLALSLTTALNLKTLWHASIKTAQLSLKTVQKILSASQLCISVLTGAKINLNAGPNVLKGFETFWLFNWVIALSPTSVSELLNWTQLSASNKHAHIS